ncbi:2-oxo-4-hydroxy-4-carboxy-5-ureidoimidazoline decarboxylase [Sphaerisporangium fuscum]|uniref:2-oxo-4-hydroxy-4-carboxy-5-ureidoimidazoline decarboxylase n=1 Tax=Sphaerisporangium fuscum TaxID=2835868 RepID=UPI001BDD5659|nr:2-oxo-4-hydroxy-4-carboxy-5-ureidoimidazoline decarboxylase [Sphaerisporangium fuscum]
MPNHTLAALNALSPPQAERELLSCCASRAFARRVAAGRPYDGADDLAAAAAASVRALDWPDVLEALAAHPRIGERAAGAGRESSWSRDEQAGTVGADRRVLAELAAANFLYEQRFGHVYLVCATGLSAEEMLDRLTGRLTNDEETERAVVREELAEITRLRVARLLGDDGREGER